MPSAYSDKDRLYNLLPEIYREKDAKAGYPLRAFIRIISAQTEIIENDISNMWDNFFIDTCSRWAIPYIGDLVGNNILYGTERVQDTETENKLFEDLCGPDFCPPATVRIRADVAKTVYYRRRKGTAPMLEELAKDVTGWASRVVPFFELLNTTQHLNHIMPYHRDCPDLRRAEQLERINGPFDSISHTVDVRPICQDEGWQNIKNIGFFLWRLNSYPLENVPARKVGIAKSEWRYHFSPLGNPMPLYTRRRRENDETGLATELHIPGPIRKAFFYEDLNRLSQMETTDYTDLYALFYPREDCAMKTHCQGSFFISINGSPVPPAIIMCRQLVPWPLSRPEGETVTVDIEHGRIAIGKEWGGIKNVDVWFHYGFSAALGGGPYDRKKWLVQKKLATDILQVKEDGGGTHYSIIKAIHDWENNGRRNTIINVLDSRTYPLPEDITLSNENWLVIEATNGQRPVLKTLKSGLELKARPPKDPKNPDRSGSLTLSGVVLEGHINVTGDVGRLRFLHTTLVPGRTLNHNDGAPATKMVSLIIEGKSSGKTINANLTIEFAFCISGPLRVPDHVKHFQLFDSIIDGLYGSTAIEGNGPNHPPGPSATLERVTIIGSSYFKELSLASNVIFTNEVRVVRRQKGCVRFSFVPENSKTPRQYRCQPGLEMETQIENVEKKAGKILSDAERSLIKLGVQNWLKPSFTQENYGLPAYAQLSLQCSDLIRSGAEDEAEMGAFCHLKQPQRETNLRIRLKEYLPFGLDTGIIYVT